MAKKQSVTAESIITDIKKKNYQPVYFLMGEEPYYIDLISDYIQNNLLDEAQRDFNQTILYGKDTDMRTVINAAKRYPMMSDYQVLIVKEAQLIANWDDLSFYLQSPQATTILVFCYKYKTPDKRKKWMQEISKKAVVFESAAVRDYEIAAWISNYAKRKGLAIEEKATAMLAENLGTDLSKIVNEIDKLLISKPEAETRITAALIEKNIGISKDYNVFELQAALVSRNVLKANRIVRYFGENKKANPAVLVLSQLFNFFSNLMLYHYLPNKTQSVVAGELRINPYFVRDYQKAATVFNPWKTLFIISYIRETDAKCKGVGNVGTAEAELLKELVYKILH